MPIIPNDTLSSVLNLVNQRASSDLVIQPPKALPHAGFTLDVSTIAGFFGGNSAVRAMATANLVSQCHWFGWYNAASAYEVAKQYSGIAKSPIFTALFPTGDSDPAKILTMVDRQVDPECTLLFFPAQKGPSSIGPLGSLVARKISQMFRVAKKPEAHPPRKENTMGTCRVTFVKLGHTLTDELNQLELVPSSSTIFMGICTILISIGGCITCTLVADWFCFASIVLGIIANGVACLVIGSGKLYLKYNPPSPSEVFTPGDAVLRTDTDIIVLIGNEGMVRPFTHGQFSLDFGAPGPDQMKSSSNVYNLGAHTTTADPMTDPPTPSRMYLIHISVILLLVQFLAQLFLIPQGTLFGQLIFIGTLGSSWMYHLYLSTVRLDLQTQTFFQMLSIQEDKDILQFQLGTPTQAAVFAYLFFGSIYLRRLLLSTMEVDGVIPELREEERDIKDTEEMAKDTADMAEVANAVEDARNAAEMVGQEVNVTEAEAESGGNAWKAANVDPTAEVANKKLAAMKAAVKVAVVKAAEAAEKVMKVKAAVVKKAKYAAENVRSSQEAMRLSAKIRESQKNKKTKDAQQMNEVFKALLDALLLGNTDALRAFKESLMRKIRELDRDNRELDRDNIDMERDNSFHFSFCDEFATVASGAGSHSEHISLAEIAHLCTYQANAETAFIAWKSIWPDIVEKFRELVNKYE